MWAISLLLLLLVETSSALRLPPALLDISRQHASAVACAALLASSQPVMPAFAVSCQLDCFKECNKVAPGSGAYCTSQCDTYCAEVGDNYQGDVVRGEATPAVSVDTSECNAYKTDAAKKYCQKEAASKAKASRPAGDEPSLAMNNGIFGDSGVTYSRGVEELFETVFGANRQNQDVSKANVGEFAGDIANAATKAFAGQAQ